jgi:4-alpha-glucanotransferase
MAGRRQEAAPETLRAVLELWGISAESPRAIRDALREDELRRWRQSLPPVIVAWDGKPAKAELRLPARLEADGIYCKLHFEDGRAKSIDWQQNRWRVLRQTEVEGTAYGTRLLPLPALPFGYHQLELEIRGRVHRCMIISAPTKSYSPPGAQKNWGLFLPIYAAHSAQSWGAGNLGDWQKLSEWAASLGARVAGTLPLLAAFLDSPVCEPSPYSPASRLFWNESYLDIPRIPEFAACASAQKLVRSVPFQRQLEAFRRSPLIDYRAEMAARRQVLERLARCFFATPSPRQDAFQKFLQLRPGAPDYAEFRATCDQTQSPWHKWEERMRNGKLQQGDYSEAVKNYHLYVQWLAQEQMTTFMDQCHDRELQFYLDLPLGVHTDGYDLWRERDAFAFPASAGAPPDMFFTKGQDWGFAPLHPQRIRERGYRYVLEYLRFQMRHTGLLRIDHVMGLHRLFWIPPGFPPTQGAYVAYPAEELHAILSLESHRHQTVIVGENLGTVPPEVNEAMARHGLRETYVVQYEQRPNPRQPLRPPPALAVASLNTHDMPTFAAHWQGLDIDDRVDLGLIPKHNLSKARQQRKKLHSALTAFLKRKGWLKTDKPDTRAIVRACLDWLAAGRAEIVLVNLEDLWQEACPQNVPGTTTERPNWRRKARLTIEEIENAAEVREVLEELSRLREEAKSC